MSASREDGYRNAMNALAFFSFPAEKQASSSRLARVQFHVPKLFNSIDSETSESSYNIGVACVFKTYQGFIYDEVVTDEASECLEGFNHRLNCMMHTESASDWSEAAMLQNESWRKLRAEAGKALEAIGNTLPEVVPVFNLGALINADEFVTSEVVLRLLE